MEKYHGNKTQQSHPYTNPAGVPFTLFSSSKGQMLALNFSRNNKSTILREETVSVSIVEIKLERVSSTREGEQWALYLRFKRIHIVKAIIELDGWELRCRGRHRVRFPLEGRWSGTHSQSKFTRTYLFTKDPADLILEHGSKPLI